MNEKEVLAEQFEANRGQLRAVAYRMLGSLAEADDAVQEAWLRLNRSDAGSVENLGGWLTTVVARVCLDMLRSRKSRREDPSDFYVPDPILSRGGGQRPGTTRRCSPTRSAWPCSSCLRRSPRPSGSRSCCTTCSRSRSRRSHRSLTGHRPRPGSWPAGPAAGCRARHPFPIPTSPAARSRRRLPRGRAWRRLRCAGRRARPGRRAAGRRWRPARGRLEGGPRCGDGCRSGAHLRSVRSVRPPRNRQRRLGIRRGSRGRSALGTGFHRVGGKIVEIDILTDPERLARLDLAFLDD